jgi:RHS repeat-associated protein
MANSSKSHVENKAAEERSAFTAPPISLPKGGGAIRGMGEKFAANPVSGTGSMSVPIATSSGRSGFGPQLALSYDSGSGNSPFGFGWSLSLPDITRKTDKGLPLYYDADESDVFLLSGAEDLVPEYKKGPNNDWVIQNGQHVLYEEPRIVDGIAYTVRRYRPRIEGLFARIECWTNRADPADVHWRSISKDNILTLYGKDENSRIVDPDPAKASHIFTWLICETRDDNGNAVRYEYQPEDEKGLDLTQANEANRGSENKNQRRVNRYIKHITYGNTRSLLVDGQRPTFLTQAAMDGASWMFEVVFDYGEHHKDNPLPRDSGDWQLRSDPFSSYRAGFEVRTYRLCRRVLMFHHFDGEAGVEKDCLVRSTDFTYSHQQNPQDARNPIYTFLLAATHTSYKRNNGGYLKRSLPPVEFEYTQPSVQDRVEWVDAESLENLPLGLDGGVFQWTDLHGEGIPGILTEQGGAWFYKRNLSPLTGKPSEGPGLEKARFGPLERVATRPNLALAGGAQFMDLAGDGLPDLVMWDGPVPGLYEHDSDEGWQPFRPFSARLNRDMSDPNLRMIDLDGDGHADVLVTEDEAFVWHPSLGEAGFGPAQRVHQMLDEEKGPRLVFADGTQSIYLADMSGDGLTDLARIRNGEVCYWPNLGYGRFGAKVTMDFSPDQDPAGHFDHPDQFDQKRIRLADIDGSGTTDIIYLHRKGVRLYFNQSGNRWSAPQILNVFPCVDDVVNIMPADLLGNGTACLVWSSPLPGDDRQQMRYVNLMGGQKPHLLIGIKNNLGAEIRIQYAPSTKFYLQDREQGQPWITRLPFPVHVVERMFVTDKWRGTTFSTRYSYHHGYFDGDEREFRGFGRVEQVDVEAYGKFEQGTPASQYITDDRRLFQPPVKTISWYHTGAFLDRERILTQFEQEYFPHWLEDQNPPLALAYRENLLPEPDLAAEELSAVEWREALRACKGMLLRQEVIELNVEALERPDQPEEIPVRLLSSAYHNCTIRLLQPQEGNRHAVFLVAESEAVTNHYELDLRAGPLADLQPDPRIAHTLNLKIDEYGSVLESAAVVYPRLTAFEEDARLAEKLEDALPLIHQVQNEIHLAYSVTNYTADFDDGLDNYRLRVPEEGQTYELYGIEPGPGLYFTLKQLREKNLSGLTGIPYHQGKKVTTPARRLVAHTRTLFFAENLANPLPFGEHGRLGLTYETYKLVMTTALLDAVFKGVAENHKLDETIDGVSTARARLNHPEISGYLSGDLLVERFAPTPAAALAGQYWVRSGIAGFAPDAARHFYLPEKYTDPFGSITTIEYDPRDLFVASSTDALSNTTRITQTPDQKFNFDYRVLAPHEMQDINNNLSEVFYDVLGLPAAMALKGKGTEGDHLAGFSDALANPDLARLEAFFVEEKPYDEAQARAWLGTATARHVYYFGETLVDGKLTWGTNPACACGIVREQHASQLGPGENSPVQSAFEYTDGLGSVVVKKIQAEPEIEAADQPLRWVASGKTILNNKGKPVKQYEPYFSPPQVGHRFEDPLEIGVTAVIYYDAAGRVMRTEMPDGSFSRVEFSPWHVLSFDQNDTVKDSQWYSDHNPPDPGQPLPRSPITGELQVTPDQRAAWLAAQHAGTPSLTILDSLGREVISVAHNRVSAEGGVVKDEKYLTYTRLDAEGKPLWIRDARKNLVMQYIVPPMRNDQPIDTTADFAPCYDIAGNLLFQHSMDAGDRWTLNDAVGKPMLGWDDRQHFFYTEYDELHRPSASFVKGADEVDTNRVILYEKLVYGDTPGNGLSDTPGNDQTRNLNLRGKPYRHFDTAGIATGMGRSPITGREEAFDFKGNSLRSTRQLVKDYKKTPDWSQAPVLEAETFTSSTRYDALNRPVQLVAPHSDQPGTRFNIIRPGYNEANLLEQVHVWLEQTPEPTALLNPATANLKAVANIDYDAKGQRIRIEYNEVNHPIVTQYTYDRQSFRLTGLRSTRPLHSDPSKRTLQDLSYTYDPSGNITDIRDAAQQAVFYDNASIEPSNAYSYDALYRLIHAEGREHTVQNNIQRDARKFETINGVPFPNSPEALQRYSEQYEYDSVGNILGMQHSGGEAERWVRWYQYALNSNRLLATRSAGEADKLPFYAAAPGYSARYTYDAHGSMTSMPHLSIMAWDFKDQLQASAQQVRNDGGKPEITYYVYDAGGQRVRKVTERQSAPGQTPSRMKERIYLGGFELYREYNAAGTGVTLARETLHIMDDQQRIALVETRTDTPAPERLVRYQLGNHLGSAALELDDQAQMISYEEFHPYGTTAYEAARSMAETPKRYRYTGKERDEETGFTYHGARYYAPWLGRWTSADQIGIGAGTNLYMYVKGNSIRMIDPSGNDDEQSPLEKHYQDASLHKIAGPPPPPSDATKQGKPPNNGTQQNGNISIIPGLAGGLRGASPLPVAPFTFVVRKEDFDAVQVAIPSKFGMTPSNKNAQFSPGEHALAEHLYRTSPGQKRPGSQFLSASERPLGAANIEGQRFWIDVDEAKKAGLKFYSNEEIALDLDRMVKLDPSLKPRVDMWKSAQPGEGEVLFEGSYIPPNAVNSSLGRVGKLAIRTGEGVLFVGTLAVQDTPEKTHEALFEFLVGASIMKLAISNPAVTAYFGSLAVGAGTFYLQQKVYSATGRMLDEGLSRAAQDPATLQPEPKKNLWDYIFSK